MLFHFISGFVRKVEMLKMMKLVLMIVLRMIYVSEVDRFFCKIIDQIPDELQIWVISQFNL